MFNRWFHRARLHVPERGQERKVGWLELFYDLIYVATIIQMGDALSHDVSFPGCVKFAGLFVPIWLTWTAFTFYSNRFVIDDFAHRALVFLQMFAIGGMAVSVADVWHGDISVFVPCYVFARLVIVGLYHRAWRHVEEARDLTRRYWIGYLVGAVVWACSLLVPSPWFVLVWGLGVAVDLSVPLSSKARELASRFPPDVLHASERYGLLTIIVLGESFVKVLTAVADKGLGPDIALMGSIGLAITCSLWWVYFDDVAGSRIRRTRIAPFAWVYAHLPLTIGVTGVGVAIKKLALMDPMEHPHADYAWLMCGMLALVLLSVGMIDSVTERRQAELSDTLRVRIRLGSAFGILLIGAVAPTMPGWMFAALAAGVMVAQVFLDLSFSPMFHDHMEAEEEDHAMFDRVGDVPEAAPARRELGVNDAVRKGAPTELRRDLYFHLMEASWTQLSAWVVGIYLVVNVGFACLFLLEPWGVNGMSANSFVEAFSFSVQTMATIGFGAMYPDSSYAHGLVAVESLVGLLGVAMVTGLMFAKAARPTPSVLYSSFPVVTTRHGKPTLSFRVGNARGNDIVDATMKVVALKAEVTPEGENMRRLYDLKLLRDNQPLFSLSWSLMHEIDEDSPLFGLDPDNPGDTFLVLVAIVTGHDATYGQTIHARHLYQPHDLRIGHRYVDIVSTLEDGRLMVDYTKFHLTEPDPNSD